MHADEPLVEIAGTEGDDLPIDEQKARRRGHDGEVQGRAAVVLGAALHAAVDHGEERIGLSEIDGLAAFEKLVD